MKKIIAEISARHIHLSATDLARLFGASYKLKKLKALSQPGEFACQETLLVIGPKGRLKIRIVGPIRTKTQVELALTDGRTLGLEPFFRLSGDHQGTKGELTLRGPRASIKLRRGVIVPLRHLHISASQAQRWGLKDRQKVSVWVKVGPRPLVFQDIIVRFGNYHTSLHLDTDEANAAGLLTGSQVYLDI